MHKLNFTSHYDYSEFSGHNNEFSYMPTGDSVVVEKLSSKTEAYECISIALTPHFVVLINMKYMRLNPCCG